MKILLVLGLVASVVSQRSIARAGVVEDGPQLLKDVSSIRESLRSAGTKPLHILYVHGIGAHGAGDSANFRESLCKRLTGCANSGTNPIRERADSGMFAAGSNPPGYEYLQNPVWSTQEEWAASVPFVDHYVMTRSDGGPVVVDEINWWPLVFPLKCRSILAGESRLSGPDTTLINLCAGGSFAWISKDDVTQWTAIRPRGALLNRKLKTGILDWGFSDAIMAVGSMNDIFREGMRQLFVKSAGFTPAGQGTSAWARGAADTDADADKEFVVVSHSLGSYLVFSTLNIGATAAEEDRSFRAPRNDAEKEDSAARYILERTSLVYFFANQVPLLELADVIRSHNPAARPDGTTQSSLSTNIQKWKSMRENFVASSAKVPARTPQAAAPQLIALSDPSDLLTWRVPGMKGVVVANLFVRNTRWHWLFAEPSGAHGNYAVNGDVLKVMMK